MKNIELKYGKNTININVPKKNLIGILKPKISHQNICEKLEAKEVARALMNPIESPRISEIAKPGEKAAIMVSDITRPVPSRKLIPGILDELNKAGIEERDITIIFGMGIHRSHTLEEQKKLVGEKVFNRIKCVDSNKDEYIFIGQSSKGTPLYLCKTIVEADVRICTGNIEYHYFAGFSGGAKAIMPGAANYESIKHNHKLQLQPGVATGKIIGNPVREDIDEIGEILGISFILNVVLNEKKQILKAFAGDYIKAHREGCRYLDSIYGVEIEEKADIVIVSPGGYPKDVNLYQAQKSLDNAKYAIKENGTIILLAECIEGFGSKTFEEWIRAADSPKELVERLKREFKLGGHKGAAIARILLNNGVYIKTTMKKEDIEEIFFESIDSVQETLDGFIEKSDGNIKILIIPYGGSILPKAY